MNNLRKMSAFLGAGAVMFSLVGCADKDGSGQAESPANANNVDGAVKDNLGDTANAVTGAVGGAADAVTGAVGGAADAVTGAAAGAGNAIASGANKMGGAVESGANKMGGAMANAGKAATITPAVKNALNTNPGLKGVTINVDTLAAKNTIALRGKVKSANQKTLAAAIAKKAAPGYTVTNQLTVGN